MQLLHHGLVQIGKQIIHNQGQAGMRVWMTCNHRTIGYGGKETGYDCIETGHDAIETILGHVCAEIKYNGPMIKSFKLLTKK